MSAKAGESAQKTGDFKCEKCGEKVHVTQGKEIPKCPKCGNDTYGERENEPGNKSTKK
jgi:ribosomal protein L37AE/L43A